MPLAPLNRYTGIKITPAIAPELAVQWANKFQASLNLNRGSLVAIAKTGVSAVMTLTCSGTPTGGTFTLSYNGFTTSALAYNCAASDVQTALQALPSIGSGNVTCSGGAFPGTAIVITFAGTMANIPVSLLTIASQALTGGSNPLITIALTTAGVVAGGLKAWNGALLAAPAAPTATAVAGGTFWGDGTNNYHYLVSATYVNSIGQTTPSPMSQVVITSTNRTIRIAALTGIPNGVTAVNIYVNSMLCAVIAVAANATAQTDIATPGTNAGDPPTVNTCYSAVDGSAQIFGIAMVDIATDGDGKVSYSNLAQGMDHYEKYQDGPVWIGGYFRLGDLTGYSGWGPQLANQVKFLTLDYTDPEAIIKLG